MFQVREINNIIMQDTTRKDSPENKATFDKRKNHDLRDYIKELEFNNNILQAQQELSLDGILVVDENWRMVSFNSRFLEMWQIPQSAYAERDDKKSIQSVLDKLKSPESFLARVEELMKSPDEHSRDELELLDGRVFDRYSAPIYDSKNHLRGRVWFFRDISELIQARSYLNERNTVLEQMISERTSELHLLNSELKLREQELHAKNMGLRALLNSVEEEKQYLKEKTTNNFNKALHPLLEMLKETSLSEKQELLLNSFEHVLDNMSSAMNTTLTNCRNPLTPTELKIANFIAAGKTSKEISSILNTSKRTVEGHRSSIRKKLGLKYNDNLQTRLLAFI